MPTSETLERFIARVEQNAHVEAVEEFYTADASMQENHDGTFSHLEELAWQRWAGERIAQETFFYDPVQRVPRSWPI